MSPERAVASRTASARRRPRCAAGQGKCTNRVPLDATRVRGVPRILAAMWQPWRPTPTLATLGTRRSSRSPRPAAACRKQQQSTGLCIRSPTMSRLVDLADLLDAREVAEVLGLGSRNSVSVYARRHEDFPRPVIDKADGHTKLWLRSEVEAWRQRHPGRRQARA